MKKLFLIPLAISCIASGMQQPKASAQACATYKSYLHSKLHPTTVTFYQCHPQVPESKFIQRYVDEFIRMATQSSTTPITTAHCKEIWETTPSDHDIAEIQNRIKRMAAQRVKQITLNENQITALPYDIYLRLLAASKTEIKINQEA